MGHLPFQPERASEHASAYDSLFLTISGLSLFFTILVVLIIFYLAKKYRRGSAADRKNPVDSHLALELGMTIVPLILALGIFVWSTKNFIKQREMPEDAMEVFVIGKQWMWHVQHMNGIRENAELHVPVNTPIKLTMISQDVLHAMYLPEFRAQYHVVPGRYTDLHFTATKPGVYKMLCAMHCGTQHSEMVGKVYVLSEKDYAEWVETGGNRFAAKAESMEAAGGDLFAKKGCGNCHTAKNTDRAPSLSGVFGNVRSFTDGSTAVADDNYLRESILEPEKRLTQGYTYTMPVYKGQLTEEHVLQLVAYIKSQQSAAAATGVVPYEQPDRPVGIGPTSPDNATRTANERKSAGATQFRETTGGKR